MKLRFQFGAVFTACLSAGLLCGSVYGQKFSTAAQQEGAQPRPGPRPRVRPRLPNALPPAGKANNLPPKAIERLQDLPPNLQERFLQNNERFKNLPPDRFQPSFCCR